MVKCWRGILYHSDLVGQHEYSGCTELNFENKVHVNALSETFQKHSVTSNTFPNSLLAGVKQKLVVTHVGGVNEEKS